MPGPIRFEVLPVNNGFVVSASVEVPMAADAAPSFSLFGGHRETAIHTERYIAQSLDQALVVVAAIMRGDPAPQTQIPEAFK